MLVCEIWANFAIFVIDMLQTALGLFDVARRLKLTNEIVRKGQKLLVSSLGCAQLVSEMKI
jgi:hypothetical protein